MPEEPKDRIELLSVALLDRHRPIVVELRQLAQMLDLEFGWHYLLDLTWIISRLGEIRDKRIMDAGAGTGVMQWYLARQGAEVISVDRLSRAHLPMRFRSHFHIEGLRAQDLQPNRQVFIHDFRSQKNLHGKFSSQARNLRGLAYFGDKLGKVIIYNQDLKDLQDIPDKSLDAVVAVSALEHNAPEDLEKVVVELMRVLKPGGVLAASLNASRGEDWWHGPSSGWCYSEESLRRLFGFSPDLPTNYNRYDDYLLALRGCAELRDNLAKFYFKSDKNGMPWGNWDPQYLPVGVLKVKA